MIGQKHIREFIDLNVDKLPHFIVLIGDRGGGKRTLAKYIAEKLDATYSEVGIKVDDVREVVNTSSLSATKVLYCFADADNMRPEAKNAMLKITEEAPDNAYFVLTVTNEKSLLDTIKSRAFVFKMQNYTTEELGDYIKLKDYPESNLLFIASTPYEIDMLYLYGKEFFDYVNLVLDNIAEVEPANAFKSSFKLNIKNEDGYDIVLFFKALRFILINRLFASGETKYANSILVTSTAIGKLSEMSVNKQQVYDSWVFKIREALI